MRYFSIAEPELVYAIYLAKHRLKWYLDFLDGQICDAGQDLQSKTRQLKIRSVCDGYLAKGLMVQLHWAFAVELLFQKKKHHFSGENPFF